MAAVAVAAETAAEGVEGEVGVGGEVVGVGKGLAGRVMGAAGLAMGARGGEEERDRYAEAMTDQEDGGPVTEGDGLGQGESGEEVGRGSDASVTEASAIDSGNGGGEEAGLEGEEEGAGEGGL